MSNKRTSKNLIFDLLRCFLNEEDFIIDKQILDNNYEALIKISKRHDILSIIAYILLNRNYINNEELKKVSYVSIYRYETQKYKILKLIEELNSNKIDFILLKGAVIRDYYLEPYLRTSCDIDVLIKEKQVSEATGMSRKVCKPFF